MKKKRGYFVGGMCCVLLGWWWSLPTDLFEGIPYSTVVTDRHGELLGARIADDGQWRFPPCDSLPEKFVAALLQFEDRTFYRHPGVSVRALLRAVVQNVRNGRVVSGASTITMQLARMARRKERTLWQKCIEMLWALRLEVCYSKQELLCMYASHAPFGGNVVGIEAALWRYLGNDGRHLSWAEAATLAVLQNAPSSVNLSKRREMLLAKRNRLLLRLREEGYLTEFDYTMAVEEPLIGQPVALPRHAPHWVEWFDAKQHGRKSVTSIELTSQRLLEQLTDRWCEESRSRGMNDLAAVVVDVHSGDVVAYCGNADMDFKRPGVHVDIARSPRSSGSLLKPLLYCAALQEGIILPRSLLLDIPTNFGGFVPRNFNLQFEGAVPADEALWRSLNVPHVYLLKKYGVSRFVELLKQAGISTLDRSAKAYGLSLILGGAEVNLLEITRLYARLAAYYQNESSMTLQKHFPFTDRVAIYHMLEALREVNRPGEVDWSKISSGFPVAWKTGTSYGARDAWAVGVTPDYAVGVWVGNAEGQGCPDLTGTRVAGPVLFDIFNALPLVREECKWFAPPSLEVGRKALVCKRSGHLATGDCSDTMTCVLPKKAEQSQPCPYHQLVALSLDGKFRAINRGEPVQIVSMFFLPPVVEYYYRQSHVEYIPLPPLKANEKEEDGRESMRFIYPTPDAVLVIPRQLNGKQGGFTFRVAHGHPRQTLFWHLDRDYIGLTEDLHEMYLCPQRGKHTVTVVDATGERVHVDFTVI